MNKTFNKKVTITAGTVAAVIVVLLGANIYLLANNKTATAGQSEKEKRSVVITESNVGDVLDSLTGESDEAAQATEAPAYYTVKMNNTWHFETGDAATYDAYVANSTKNTTAVYFDLFLDGDEKNAIYQSPVIPLGGELTGFSLDQPLAAGTYDCVMIYHLVDEEQNTLSLLRVAVTIVVEG